MKRLTASEARDLTELAGMSEIYEEILRRAQVGLTTAEFTDITEYEFKQLIADGYDVFIEYGTAQLTKFDKETLEEADYVIVDWSV